MCGKKKAIYTYLMYNDNTVHICIHMISFYIRALIYDVPPLSKSSAADPMHMVRWLTNVGQDLPPTHACPPQTCLGDLFGRLDAGTTEKHEHLLCTVGNSSTRAD